MDFVLDNYLWFKALHIIAMVAWMAGMLYLPRLYVYHASAEKGSDKSETFKVMERRLLRAIMNPAMIVTFLIGGLMIAANPAIMQQGWIHVKLALVLGMAGIHGFYAICRKDFERDMNTRSPAYYKIWNEIPTVLMIVIVLLAVAKPF
jgi:protoporphyrinogen IX oxidase